MSKWSKKMKILLLKNAISDINFRWMLSKYQYLTFPSLPESLLTLPTCLKVACSCCMRGSKTYCEWKSDWSNAVSNADGVVAFSKKIVLQLNAAAALVGVHVKQMRPHGTIRLYYIHSSLTYITNFIVDGHAICQLFHNFCKKKAPFWVRILQTMSMF